MLLEFRNPDRCVVGTVGAPGQRLFIVQVSQGSSLASVAIEKQQVQTLGKRIGEIVDQLVELGSIAPGPEVPNDLGPLDAPIELQFRVGAIGLAWDRERSSVQLELFSLELAENESQNEDDENVLLQIWLNPYAAREFALRTEIIVAGGRPTCPFCEQPIDPPGHICPRSNGYRGPLL